jgi:thiol-disulfide isomerase/thioredoxin
MKNALLLGLLLLPSFSFARLTDDKIHLKLNDGKISGTVDKGFHFNAKAPASIEFGKNKTEPTTKTDQEMVFDASAVKKETLKLSYYVCDDANTVCEEHTESFKIKKHQLVAVKAAAETPAPAAKEMTTAAAAAAPKKDAVKMDEHFFIRDNFQGALDLAAKEKKMVLVDFGAPWCPSCVRMETEVFGDKDFQKASKNLVKLAINVDKAENEALKKQYGVKAIPTLVILNEKGEELYRSLDFIPPKILAANIKKALGSQLKSTDELIALAKANNKEAQLTLADRYQQQLNYEEAAKWYATANEQNLSWAGADVEAWHSKYSDKKENLKEYQEVLKKWIALYPESLESLDWRDYLQSTYGEKEQTQKNALAEENVKLIEAWIASPEKRAKVFAETKMGDFSGKELVHLNTALASNYETLKKPEQQKAAQAAALAELKKMKLSVERPGEILSVLYYFRENGDKESYITWTTKLIKANPGNDTYESRLARFYLGEKRYSEALPYAVSAASRKGDREFQNLKLLADIQKGLGQKEQVKATVVKALSLPAAAKEKNKDSVAELKAMQ